MASHGVELELDKRLDEPDPDRRPNVDPARALSARPRTTRQQTLTRSQLREAYDGLTPVDLLLAGATATTPDEVDQVAHLSLAVLNHAACLRPISLPSGRQAASLHAHIHFWRHGGHGLTTDETPTSGRIRPP